MNIEELTEAMLNKREVIYQDINEGDIKYKSIQEVIMWRDRYGKLKTSVMLADYSGKSYIRADSQKVSLKGEVKCQRDTSSYTGL